MLTVPLLTDAAVPQLLLLLPLRTAACASLTCPMVEVPPTQHCAVTLAGPVAWHGRHALRSGPHRSCGCKPANVAAAAAVAWIGLQEAQVLKAVPALADALAGCQRTWLRRPPCFAGRQALGANPAFAQARGLVAPRHRAGQLPAVGARS